MSQNQTLLKHLQEGNTITSREAYTKLGITQLGRCLDDLEKEGHKFDRDTWIEVPSRHGDGKVKVKEYSLIQRGQLDAFGIPNKQTSNFY